MTNRAQVTQPYPLDMFNVLPIDSRVTFTDENTPVNYYTIIPDMTGQKKVIHASEFENHFKYYTQASIF